MKIEVMLSDAGVPNANYDSFQILSDATGINKSDYLMKTNFAVPPAHVDIVMNYAKRRAGREPLQQILGYTYFMGHKFVVDKNVLIPRYDTEVLVEKAVEILDEILGMEDHADILDMCTGSGCILLGTLLAYKDKYRKSSVSATGLGIDISDAAISLATRNAKEVGLENLVDFKKSDLFASVEGTYDMILCNPPYINSSECDVLMPEVKDFEPRLALDGGADGMDYYEKIIPVAKPFLKLGGYLIFEIGYDQGERVSELMDKTGFANVQVIKDLAGLDRVVLGHL